MRLLGLLMQASGVYVLPACIWLRWGSNRVGVVNHPVRLPATTPASRISRCRVRAALDDIKLVCGQEAEGECICDEGYIPDGSGECVADPDEAAAVASTTESVPSTAADVVSTCRDDLEGLPGLLATMYKTSCRRNDADWVCWEGRTYKSRMCALCNGASSADVKAGSCVKTPDSAGAFVTSCDDGLLDHLHFLECAFYGQQPVCDKASGVSYRNRGCATCNDASDVTLGACSAAPGGRPDPCHSVSCPQNAECARTVADCDYESGGLCGWVHDDDSGDFRWALAVGKTPTKSTGPSQDHTLGTAEGHYLYAEASGREQGDEASIVSPWLRPARLGAQCRLDFFYHMYGRNVGSLSVDVRVGKGGVFVRAWEVTPPANAAEAEHDAWKSHAHVSLAEYSHGADVQLRIRAKRGNGAKVSPEELVCRGRPAATVYIGSLCFAQQAGDHLFLSLYQRNSTLPHGTVIIAVTKVTDGTLVGL